MQPVVSVAEMRAADAAALKSVSESELVRRAGDAVAVEALGCWAAPTDDGWSSSPGRATTATTGGSPPRCWPGGARSSRCSTPSSAPSPLPACDLVIDAAYGTGFTGSYEAPELPEGARVLAVDIPSGVDGDTGEQSGRALAAESTVTFAALKPGLLMGDGPSLAGAVRVADIGVAARRRRGRPGRGRRSGRAAQAPGRLAQVGQRGGGGGRLVRAWRVRRACAHGARPGPARAWSAWRCPVRDPTRPGRGRSRRSDSHSPDKGWADDVLAMLDRCRALVIGPGLGRDDATVDAVRRLVAGAPVPVVADADALFALGDADEAEQRCWRPAARRAGRAHAPRRRVPAARRSRRRPRPGRGRPPARRATGAVVLLKGSLTAVAAPPGTAGDGPAVLLPRPGRRRSPPPGPATSSSGVIGAFLARGLDPLRAAAFAAHVHGAAARARPRRGPVSVDLPDLVADWLSAHGGTGRWLRRRSGRPGPRSTSRPRRHNVALLAEVSRPAALCAVVKADGYGHGAALVAWAALEAGAARASPSPSSRRGSSCARPGSRAPILVLSEPPADAAEAAMRRTGSPPPCTAPAGLARWTSSGRGWATSGSVHVKVDTGMHRVGLDPGRRGRASSARSRPSPGSSLEGLWTHLAVADGEGAEDRAFTAHQLDAVRAAPARRSPPPGSRPRCATPPTRPGRSPIPGARFDLVRAGIALYGELPRPVAGALADAVPAGARSARSSRSGPAVVRASATSTPGSAPPTAGADRCRRAAWWRPCPSATPTACPGDSSTPAARCSSAAAAGRSPGW